MRSFESLPGRIQEYIERSPSGCWIWLGKSSRYGYGRVYYLGGMEQAHRVVWWLLVGPVPTDRELDHLCRVRDCVNPEHLRITTTRENLLAPGSLSPSKINADKTHCKRGHLLEDAPPPRVCKECVRIRQRTTAKPKGRSA